MNKEEIRMDHYFSKVQPNLGNIKSRYPGNTDLFKVYKKSDAQANYYRTLYKNPTSVYQIEIKIFRINNFIMVEHILEFTPNFNEKTVILKNDPLLPKLEQRIAVLAPE